MPNDDKRDCATVVLVAEDETLVRLLANDILTEAGYRVLEARDGQEALTILEVHPNIQALFTDVTMPSLDGLSLARIVSERWPEIGIVITSARALPSELPRTARFLSKPYSADAVLDELAAIISDSAGRTSAAPVALLNLPLLHAGQMHGGGGLAQPLSEPKK
jgi:CheY-like chemotaxis protein